MRIIIAAQLIVKQQVKSVQSKWWVGTNQIVPLSYSSSYYPKKVFKIIIIIIKCKKRQQQHTKTTVNDQQNIKK